MSNNLAELIEYLELYKVLLESKYYTPSKEDEANELMEAIENAKKKAQYTFFSLKQDVYCVFFSNFAAEWNYNDDQNIG